MDVIGDIEEYIKVNLIHVDCNDGGDDYEVNMDIDDLFILKGLIDRAIKDWSKEGMAYNNLKE